MKTRYPTRALSMLLALLAFSLAPFGKTQARAAAGHALANELDGCSVTAATLTPDVSTVALADGTATLTASVASPGSSVEGFESVFVLTMGEELIIKAVSTSPSFTVDMAGAYRIHNLVANVDIDDGFDFDQLDLSVVVPGTTPASAVLALIEKFEICAALELPGAMFMVVGESDDDGVMTGMIASSTGENPVAVCVGDDDDDDDHDDDDSDDDDSDDSDDSDSGSTVTVDLGYATPVGQVAYVLTDKDFNILEIQDDATFDFSDNAPGTYHLWAFNYTGEITGMVGDNVFETQFSDDEWLISQNCIIVNVGDGCGDDDDDAGNVDEVMTGTIASSIGENPVAVCVGDGDDDDDDDDHDDDDDDDDDDSDLDGRSTVTVDLGYATPVGQVAYVLTDKDFNILEIQDDATFDFSDNAPGTYHLWAFNYTGEITGMVGDNVFETQFSDDEWLISQNCIIVNVGDGCQPRPDAGMITFDDGSTSQDVCIREGAGGTVAVAQTGTPEGESQTYLITDMDGNILGIPGGSGPFDLSGAGPGTCLIWYLSYNGSISGLSVGANATELMGDFELSNAISAVRSSVDGGTIAFADGSTSKTIVADGNAEAFEVQQTGTAVGSNFAFVITDMDANVLAIQADATVDLSGAPAGTCLIWYLAFEDNLGGAMAGNNAADLTGCFDLSNPLTVVREEPTGIIATRISAMDGGNAVAVCIDNDDDDDHDSDDDDDDHDSDSDDDDDHDHDGGSDSRTMVTAEFTLASNTGQVAYVLTDKDFNILEIQDDATFDFSDNAPGTYHIWAFNYTGEITGMVGDNVFETQFSTEEWLISQNCIVVTVGDDCADLEPTFNFTVAPLSQDEVVIRRAADEFAEVSETVAIRITSATGRLVNSVDNVPAEALDAYLLGTNGSGSGMYFVTVIRNGAVVTKQVVLQ